MIKQVLLIMYLAIIPVAVFSQDKMAAISPTDVKMKSVDTLMLHQLRSREIGIITANKNKNLIPDSFVVNLKHFRMPTPSKVITSGYGKRWGRMHKGLDIKVYIGDTIVSAFDGKVVKVAEEPNGYGKYIVVKHNNGLETVYAHLSKHLVVQNQNVKAGIPIGLGGNTGRSTGSHLHFETRLFGIAINPAYMFDFVHQDVTDDFYVFRKKEHTVISKK